QLGPIWEYRAEIPAYIGHQFSQDGPRQSRRGRGRLLYSQINKAALPAGISHSAVPSVIPTCSARAGRNEPSAPTGEPAKVVSCSSSSRGAIRRSSETRLPEEFARSLSRTFFSPSLLMATARSLP